MAAFQMQLGQQSSIEQSILPNRLAMDSNSSDSEDTDNIPYHARENAKPFTYGSIPEGFSQSELNHVAIEEVLDTPKAKRAQTVLPYAASPTVARKSTRPSISPSRPVLKKTPSRQEFEEMLMERREQALKEQNNYATQLAQNAAIQKDLDELQEKLNKANMFGEKHKELAVVIKNNESTNDENDDTQKLQLSSNWEPVLPITEQKRSETPSFPLVSKVSDRCTSPYPPITMGSPTFQRSVAFAMPDPDIEKSSNHSVSTGNETHEVEPHLVKFAKDSSEYWYKPHITREEAVALLQNAQPGTFLIRNSTTYKNSYGLVLRVAKHPLAGSTGVSNGAELVRHFLVEPTTRGVRLKGCANEPIFTSLSAFVYQHSINRMALPCTLTIPDRDLLLGLSDAELVAKQKQILSQGAACNVLYLFSCQMESLTGDEAVRKAVYEMYAQRNLQPPVEVHFKVCQQGITLTDNTRKVFFRRHYAAQNISHFSLDPDHRFWTVTASDEGLERGVNKSIFAFVARPLTGPKDNQCHIFCDLAATQPASAIVSFAHKVLPLNVLSHKML